MLTFLHRSNILNGKVRIHWSWIWDCGSCKFKLPLKTTYNLGIAHKIVLPSKHINLKPGGHTRDNFLILFDLDWEYFCYAINAFFFKIIKQEEIASCVTLVLGPLCTRLKMTVLYLWYEAVSKHTFSQRVVFCSLVCKVP